VEALRIRPKLRVIVRSASFPCVSGLSILLPHAIKESWIVTSNLSVFGLFILHEKALFNSTTFFLLDKAAPPGRVRRCVVLDSMKMQNSLAVTRYR
jgi:hypothetical protein